MKLCAMCADHEVRECSGQPELARCEGCGHVLPCYDDRKTHKQPPIRKGSKKPGRGFKFRIRW